MAVEGAILAPGYGGTSEQPLLIRLSDALSERNIPSRRITFQRRGRPSPGFEEEQEDLRQARELLHRRQLRHLALIGRSFGGRVCTFLAAAEAPTALVVLGYPIAPKSVLRTGDEAALLAVRCPTLIIQGDRDELGPLPVLRRIIRRNKAIQLKVIRGAGHAYGTKAREALAISAALEFLDTLSPQRDKRPSRG